MQMIGQDDDRVDAKRPLGLHAAESGPQAVDVHGQQLPLAFEQRDGEKVRATGDSGANVVGHGVGRSMLDGMCKE